MAISLLATLAVIGIKALGTDADDALLLPLRAHASFPFNSPDRPIVHFPLAPVHNCTALLLSDDRLYVGAQDAVLSLDVTEGDDITLRSNVTWQPSESDVAECERKGKNATADCGNFVAVLQLLNASHLYACGSFAFNPHDSFLDADTLAMTSPQVSRGRCPFNPFQRSAALAADGELFTATTKDFWGNSPLIARHFSKDGHPDVTQESSPFLLEEPNFVGTALDAVQRKVFFFFSEVAKEFNVQEEMRVARVVSVCQDDVGGSQILQKKWTSLVKTTLSCLSPFNVLIDVFTLPPIEGEDPTGTLFYAIFVSQWSFRPESVVCSFRLASIREVFAGPYRTFDAKTDQWNPLLTRRPFGQCDLDSASHDKLEEVKRTFLTGGRVAPDQGGPLLVSAHQRYSRMAVMRVRGSDKRSYQVLFLLTENGLLHKVFLSARGPRLIEEIKVLERGERVTAFVLSASKGMMFVGSWSAVTAVPVARCSAYTTCGRCLISRDPFCGWSQSGKRCVQLEHQKPQDTEEEEQTFQLLEGGDVLKVCGGEGRSPFVKKVVASANEVVKLACYKPWESSTLTWTCSRFPVLPRNLFIQSDDGSLTFIASENTSGEYRCKAEENGYTEAVASYDVIPASGPRSMRPGAQVDEPIWVEPSSPPGAHCERRGYHGALVGLAVCACFLLAAVSMVCIGRKLKARHVSPFYAKVDKQKGGVPEMGVELRQEPEKQHLTDTPA
ncbi:semaphorin-4B-like isoform X2 [Corythoichthys intestinalis]|uniref:semaphorin-4B-like isoform X2 n=1 Tax=Corythoichthys intestinalis TaxID=161448 RepID=UPI0025A62610|nr:semaphorin-4B-like isoform X2 [Corythoichthys intestinalis]XP_061789099.1 semaphorin-4B-like [Nerophis lumbriciformis]